jgi:hypothetical protein
MLPVWQASGALFPSIYLDDAPAPDAVRAHQLNTTVKVAVAAAEMVRAAEGGTELVFGQIFTLEEWHSIE